MKNIFIQTLLLSAILIVVTACNDDDKTPAVGDVAVSVDGNNRMAPATLTFTAEAENSTVVIWDFGYAKEVTEGEGAVPMGAVGEAVTMTFEEPGTYSVTVRVLNKNNEAKNSNLTVTVFSEEDLSYEMVEAENTFVQNRDLCTNELTPAVDVDLSVDAVNGFLIEEYYLTKSWNDQIITDTVRDVDFNWHVTTYEALLDGFTEVPDVLDEGEEITLGISAKLTNDEGTIVEIGSTVVTATIHDNYTGPVLPEGKWRAENLTTGFSSDIYLVQTGTNKFWVSDFGMDWSNWRDYWYTTEFSVSCEGEVILDAEGRDNPTDFEIPAGVNASARPNGIRIMPYRVLSGTPTYDATNRKVIFSNVQVTDDWWNADTHTINITFTFLE